MSTDVALVAGIVSVIVDSTIATRDCLVAVLTRFSTSFGVWPSAVRRSCMVCLPEKEQALRIVFNIRVRGGTPAGGAMHRRVGCIVFRTPRPRKL